MQRWKSLWEDIRSSLWFVPGTLTAVAIATAWLMGHVDRWLLQTDMQEIAWAFSGGAESARQILGTIAGSMITITGVTFSITMVALVLASGQYSPRVLRNFMRDHVNQTLLGFFVGTFVYTVLVLRTIRSGEDPYVPGMGITMAIFLAVVSLGLFIYFIHHMAESIQATTIIRNVALDTHAQIERSFGHAVNPIGPAWICAIPDPTPDGYGVRAQKEGYIDRLDTAALVEAAVENGLSIQLLLGPGDFSARGSLLAVADRDPADSDRFDQRVRSAITIGRQRTISQDPSFGFRQLVDIAVKALSPGINDPTTACNCIDYLGSLLRQLTDREWPSTEFRDEVGDVRVRTPSASYRDYVTLACTEIRRYGAEDLSVTLRLLQALRGAAAATTREERRQALWEQANAIREGAASGIGLPVDRARVEGAFRALAAELGYREDRIPSMGIDTV